MVKVALEEHGNTLQKTGALSWKNNCHWLQAKEL